MSDIMVFDELETASGHRVGLATLNSPRTLNGLSLAMCERLDARLRAWQDDPAIAAVLLDGAGGKAFCAGGDLHSLYRAMLENRGGPWENAYARRFFEVEYRLDFLIHRYRKPLVCWGSGIVMGGGVGLMMGASHRIVTETTRFAMPEVSIGLYPDVAGTWMLSRLPRGIGVFLALTGAQLGASDCLRLGLADRACRSTGLADLRAALAATAWSTDPEARAGQVDRLLDGLADPGLTAAPGPLQVHFDAIRAACDRADFTDACARIGAWAGHEDPWLARAAATFAAGSPGSARLGHTLVGRMRHLSLADVFREEYVVSLQCTAQGDFQEGIRALLIDKDKSPKWRPATHEEAGAQWVERFFRRPWPEGQPHPLADLGA